MKCTEVTGITLSIQPFSFLRVLLRGVTIAQLTLHISLLYIVMSLNMSMIPMIYLDFQHIRHLHFSILPYFEISLSRYLSPYIYYHKLLDHEMITHYFYGPCLRVHARYPVNTNCEQNKVSDHKRRHCKASDGMLLGCLRLVDDTLFSITSLVYGERKRHKTQR